jgi:hypothetical protein
MHFAVARTNSNCLEIRLRAAGRLLLLRASRRPACATTDFDTAPLFLCLYAQMTCYLRLSTAAAAARGCGLGPS